MDYVIDVSAFYCVHSIYLPRNWQEILGQLEDLAWVMG